MIRELILAAAIAVSGCTSITPEDKELLVETSIQYAMLKAEINEVDQVRKVLLSFRAVVNNSTDLDVVSDDFIDKYINDTSLEPEDKIYLTFLVKFSISKVNVDLPADEFKVKVVEYIDIILGNLDVLSN